MSDKSQANTARSEKMTGNRNAVKQGRTRTPVVLSIADKRQQWVIEQLQAKGIKDPTNAEIIRYVKDLCYGAIDEERSNAK